MIQKFIPLLLLLFACGAHTSPYDSASPSSAGTVITEDVTYRKEWVGGDNVEDIGMLARNLAPVDFCGVDEGFLSLKVDGRHQKLIEVAEKVSAAWQGRLIIRPSDDRITVHQLVQAVISFDRVLRAEFEDHIGHDVTYQEYTAIAEYVVAEATYEAFMNKYEDVKLATNQLDARNTPVAVSMRKRALFGVALEIAYFMMTERAHDVDMGDAIGLNPPIPALELPGELELGEYWLEYIVIDPALELRRARNRCIYRQEIILGKGVGNHSCPDEFDDGISFEDLAAGFPAEDKTPSPIQWMVYVPASTKFPKGYNRSRIHYGESIIRGYDGSLSGEAERQWLKNVGLKSLPNGIAIYPGA